MSPWRERASGGGDSPGGAGPNCRRIEGPGHEAGPDNGPGQDARRASHEDNVNLLWHRGAIAGMMGDSLKSRTKPEPVEPRL